MISPCEGCPSQARCTIICKKFADWFIPEWNKTVADLKKKCGLREEMK